MEQERKVGNEYEVNICVKMNGSGFEEEQLTTTLSYADIYELVKNIMHQEMLLLETACKRICESIAQNSENVIKVTVEITKLAVPIEGIAGECSVEYVLDSGN